MNVGKCPMLAVFCDGFMKAGAGMPAGMAGQGILRQNDFNHLFQQERQGDRMTTNDTHSKTIGYILWIFGFMGAHRFYYGRQITGTIWFFTLGLLFVGWIIDLFLIPSMDRDADRKYHAGQVDYTVGWILLTFLGVFGIHRFYMGKWLTGLLWLLTGGLFLVGYLYDYWTLNGQIDELNRQG
jgi:TM2 domain-containing membrane protein YozV